MSPNGETTARSAFASAMDLAIVPAAVADGQYGSPYTAQQLRVTGGRGDYTFSITAGNLPPGMSLAQDGTLSGTPNAAGRYSFTVEADGTLIIGLGGSVSQVYTLVIDQATLTVTANDVATTYGHAVPALTVSYVGFVPGDNPSSLASQPGASTAATSTSPAGTYPINVSGGADPNYNFAYVSGKLTIGPANMTVTAIAQKKTYGAPDPTLSYTATGFLNGDNMGVFSGNLSRASGENVGNYPINKGSLDAGDNYTISFTGSFLTITIGSQQITWNQNLSIGCTNATKVRLNATASSGLPVSYTVADPTIASLSGSVLTLLRPGATTVTAFQSGDANHSAAQSVTDTVSYQPASLIRQQWADAIFFDNSSEEYVKWQWYKNGQAVPNATDPYYSETPSLNGQYFVIATNQAGQQIQSCTLAITGGAAISGGIKANPNPVSAGGSVTVTSSYTDAALKGAVLQVIDLSGKIRQQVTTVQPTMPVTMPAESGIYIINLLLTNGQKASVNVLVHS